MSKAKDISSRVGIVLWELLSLDSKFNVIMMVFEYIFMERYFNLKLQGFTTSFSRYFCYNSYLDNLKLQVIHSFEQVCFT